MGVRTFVSLSVAAAIAAALWIPLAGCIGIGDTSAGTLLFSTGLIPNTFGGQGRPPAGDDDDDDDDDDGGGGEEPSTDPICITWVNDGDDPALVSLYTSANPAISFGQIILGVPELLPQTDQPCVEEADIVGLRGVTAQISNGAMLRYQVECGTANRMLFSVAGVGEPVLGGAGDSFFFITIGTDYDCGDQLLLTITQDPGSENFEIGF